MTKDELELENADLRAALLRAKDIAEEAVDSEEDDEGHPEDCDCGECEDEYED